MAEPKLDQYGFPIPEDALDRLDRPREESPPGGEPPREDRRGRGCLFYGCLSVAIGLALLIAAAVFAAWYGLRQVRENFTAAEPVEIPVVELPDERVEALQQRFEAIRRIADPDAAADDNAAEEAADEPANDEGVDPPAEPAPREVSLSAEELNAMIATQRELRGRVFVRIEDGRIGGDLSLPLDDLPLLDGRFFNARVDFDVAVEGGELIVRLADAEVNGTQVPTEILDQLAEKNLAEDAADEPGLRRFLDRVESLRVEGDRVVLRIHDPNAPAESEPGEPPPAEIEVFEDPLPAE
ncbi:MAG: hypothetical protein AAF805_06010 [Planctomycetota bacterium]